MKKKIMSKMIILGAIALFTFSAECKISEELMPDGVIQKILNSFNRLPGSTFKTDMKKCIIQSIADRQYRITFKDSTVTTDITNIIKIFYNQPFVSDKQEVGFTELNDSQIEELVFIYEPQKKYLCLESMKGMRINREFPVERLKMNESKANELKITKAAIYLQDGLFKNLDISNLLKDPKEKQVPQPIKIDDKKKENNLVFDFKDLEMELSGVTKAFGNSKEIIVKISFKEIMGSNKNENQDVWRYIVEKDAQKPDLNEILRKKEAIFDFGYETKNANMAIKVDGLPFGTFYLEQSSFLVFFKPNATEMFFESGYKFSIKNLKFSNPLLKPLEPFLSLKDFQLEFMLDHLSESTMIFLLDFTKTTMETFESGFNGPIELRMIQQMAAFSSKAIQPLAQASFTTYLNHHFGEIFLDCKIHQLMPPVGKLSITFKQIDEILNKLGKSSLFFQKYLDNFAREAVRKTNGDAVMTWELKIDQPGKYFFNGIPKKLNQNKILNNYPPLISSKDIKKS